jgi:hypothetical protein
MTMDASADPHGHACLRTGHGGTEGEDRPARNLGYSACGRQCDCRDVRVVLLFRRDVRTVKVTWAFEEHYRIEKIELVERAK